MDDVRLNAEKGFTLLELLLVLFLVGLLIGGVVPHYEGSREKTFEKLNLTNIKLIQGAAQLYRLDMGVFPTTVDDLMLNSTNNCNWRGPYLDQWPKNPYDQTKAYIIDGLGRVN
ncbi:MAG: type II secretion system protein GspG [Desulfitobacteriaceae bacterium]